MAKSVQIDGEKFSQLRSSLKLTQVELAERLGMSEASIQRFERGPTNITYKTFRRLADVARMSVEQLEIAITPESARMEKYFDAIKPVVQRMVATAPSGIGTIIPLKLIPLFESLHASALRTPPDQSHPDDDERPTIAMSSRDAPDFAARIDGDCMLPTYPPGCIVAFSYAAVEADDGVVGGKDYYVQLDGGGDGAATFKRFVRADDDGTVLVFGCLNKEKYPNEIKILSEQVVRLARAVAMQVNL